MRCHPDLGPGVPAPKDSAARPGPQNAADRNRTPPQEAAHDAQSTS